MPEPDTNTSTSESLPEKTKWDRFKFGWVHNANYNEPVDTMRNLGATVRAILHIAIGIALFSFICARTP